MYLSFFEMLFMHTRSFINKLKYRLDYREARGASTGHGPVVWKMLEVTVKDIRLLRTSAMRFTLNARLVQAIIGVQRSPGGSSPRLGSITASFAEETETMFARLYAVSFVQALHEAMTVQNLTMDKFCEWTGMSKVDFERVFVSDSLLTLASTTGPMSP